MTATIRRTTAAALSRRGFLGAGLASVLSLSDGPGRPAVQAAVNPLSEPRTRLAHLLRRAGFGATPAELDQFEAKGYEATVDWLFNYEQVPDPIEERLAGLNLDLTKVEDLRRWWVVRMAHTTRPLQEKMTLFWHGWLTSGQSKVNTPAMLQQQNQLLRDNALGNHRDLLVAISRDPAMLLWLDGNHSRKQHANENYGRELMELFTIGIGNYTEKDVQEAARAFTGWSINKDTGQAVFNARAHDAGAKTFLGRTGNLRDEDIVDTILQQRASAEFICRKIFSYFGYRSPEPGVVSSLADTYVGSGYSIKAVMRQLFLSDAFSSERAYRSLVKSPVDLVVGSLRSLGLETTGAGIPYLLRMMGQDILNPPNVAGWPGGPAWLNSTTWMQRINFLNNLATRRKGDPGTYVEVSTIALLAHIQDPEHLVNYLGEVLLDGQQSENTRTAIQAYAATGEALTLAPRSLNRKGRGVLYLTMASPEYQLL